MTRLKHSRSSLFLIELIIAILFFSAGSAVCIRAFSQAWLMSREAADLSFASAQVSSAASAVRYTDGSAEALRAYFPETEALEEEGDSRTCAVYYDEDRQPCSAAEASYILTIRTIQDGNRTDAFLSMAGPDGESIYELNLCFPSPSSLQKED